MKLSEQSAKEIRDAITVNSLLEESACEDLITSLTQEKQVNWNLVLTKQFELEQGGENEAQS